jgi:hypothetical protein
VTGPLVRTSSARPWSASWAGLAAGGACWSLNTLANYALVDWACTHRSTLIPMIAAALAAVSLAGALSSWLAWNRHDGPGVPVPEQHGHPRHLLAGIGVGCGILFGVAILMQGLAGMLLEPCLR